MFEAEIHLILLPKLILDVDKKIDEPLVCCLKLKGICVHPYAVTLGVAH